MFMYICLSSCEEARGRCQCPALTLYPTLLGQGLVNPIDMKIKTIDPSCGQINFKKPFFICVHRLFLKVGSRDQHWMWVRYGFLYFRTRSFPNM